MLIGVKDSFKSCLHPKIANFFNIWERKYFLLNRKVSKNKYINYIYIKHLSGGI